MISLSLPSQDLERYIRRLVANHLPDGAENIAIHPSHFQRALDRIEHCFNQICRKYYKQDDKAVFDHLNGDHMASFLYFLGNTIWQEGGDPSLSTRLFYLNKIMHGLDLFYSVKMPDIFLLVHPLGTVLGNATYSDYLVVYQNCTVGAVTDVYPKLGAGTILYSRSSVIGDCKCGEDVVFAANSFVVDTDIPASSIVVGQYPAQRTLGHQNPIRKRCFDPIT